MVFFIFSGKTLLEENRRESLNFAREAADKRNDSVPRGFFQKFLPYFQSFS